jgi:very-short-patch-repair endonuclease
MRHHPTYSEALLWSALRGQRLGVQFRRQQVIGEHIVDFLARQVALVVEVDGDALHAHVAAADERRDAKLRRAGYRVLRIPASLVEGDLTAAVALVREALGA